jgi:hypothetical protein
LIIDGARVIVGAGRSIVDMLAAPVSQTDICGAGVVIVAVQLSNAVALTLGADIINSAGVLIITWLSVVLMQAT